MEAAPSPATPPFSCRFVPRKCKHDQLFLDSYLRTNRTNHTKIMRCFPHCCPCHRKRSYCGSPVFVQLDQRSEPHNAGALSSDELVVFGRFRPLTSRYPPLRVGARVSLASIESSLQRDDPSTGEWVEAELSHSTLNAQDGSVSWVFEVNASARWYYPWSGAATIALRATEHVFEVLAFRRDAGAQQVRLIAEATSSKFRLMSFRRGVASSSNDDETKNAKLASRNATGEALLKTCSVAAPKSKPATKKRSRKKDNEETIVKVPPHAGPAVCLPREPSPTGTVIPRTQPRTSKLSPSAPSPVPNTLSMLGALAHWLDELPTNGAGSRRLAEWEQVVMDACAKICGVRALAPPLAPILSALHGSTTHSPQPVRQGAASPLDVIDATVRTLLHLCISPEGFVQSHPMLFPRGLDLEATNMSMRDKFMDMYAFWRERIEREASIFANCCTHAKWSDLTTIAAVLQHQERAAQSIRGDCFGYRAFVAQRREYIAQEQLRNAATRRARRRQRLDGLSMAALLEAKAPTFTRDPRVWLCRSQDVAIDMDATAMSYSLSLLALLQFWRNMSCLRLDHAPDAPRGQAAPQLCLASVFNSVVASECFTRLTLDGKYRWFHCLPSGDATSGTTFMGYIVGDYIGRATSAGTVHITTYLWPSDTLLATAAPHAFAWHWTIDTASLASASTMVMSVIIESAPIYHNDPTRPFETMTIADKLRRVGRWSHTCQVQLQYRAC